MGTQMGKFLSGRLLVDPSFRSWLRRLDDDLGPAKESRGVLVFSADDSCRKVAEGVAFRKEPTVVAMYEPAESSFMAISATVLTWTVKQATQHTELVDEMTVRDLFGMISMHRDDHWSFDMDRGGLVSEVPVLDFAKVGAPA